MNMEKEKNLEFIKVLETILRKDNIDKDFKSACEKALNSLLKNEIDKNLWK